MSDIEVFPPLIEARKALARISKVEYHAIYQMRSEGNPPEFLQCLLAALCVIFSVIPEAEMRSIRTRQATRKVGDKMSAVPDDSLDVYWKTNGAQFLLGDPHLHDLIRFYDVDKLSREAASTLFKIASRSSYVLPPEDDARYGTYWRWMDAVVQFCRTKKPLHWLAAEGMHEECIKLIARIGRRDGAEKKEEAEEVFDFDVDVKDGRGRTALLLAAQKGHARVCELLISHGADVMVSDGILGVTPLHHAAMRGSTEICEMILSVNPAAIDVVGKGGLTALHLAVSYGRSRACEALLAHSANLEAADDNGWTPLHWAARGDHAETCEILMDAGADPDVKTSASGKSAVEIAAGNRRVIEVIEAAIDRRLYAQRAFKNPLSAEDDSDI